MTHIRPISVEVFLRDVSMRLPFRFGVHTMTAAPLCLVRVRVEDEDGNLECGLSSDLLVPRWFEKTPGQSISEDWQRLLNGLRRAIACCMDEPTFASPFAHWHRIYDTCVMSDHDSPNEHVRDNNRFDRLYKSHGPAMVERALIDAVCRLCKAPFHKLIHRLGFDPQTFKKWIGDATFDDLRLDAPVRTMHFRHTIGMLDPLTRADIDPSTDPCDGLPVSLDEILRSTGTNYLKIKLCGNLAHDVERLSAIADVASSIDAKPMQITLDGNEQFDAIEDLLHLREALFQDNRCAAFYNNVLWIEQPLARSMTFEAKPNAAMQELRNWTGCIIDEADIDAAAFPEALALGYVGTSMKNCKGVFRALMNNCIAKANGAFQSAEDLTNLAAIALQQDLATASVLGITHIERNGHHYARGLEHLPKSEQDALARLHPDLYTKQNHCAMLRIDQGRLNLDSILNCSGYAHNHVIDEDAWTPLCKWSPEGMLDNLKSKGSM